MGLDWNPLGKPKTGFEAEFDSLFRQLSELPRDDSRVNSLQQRFLEIQVTPYETLRAPRVGFDPDANEWIESAYPRRREKALSLAEFTRQMHGYYVLELVPKNAGIPVYSNGETGGYCEIFSFRAQFLGDCESMLGEGLLEEAYRHHTASELAKYGQQLRDLATAFAKQYGVTAILDQRQSPDDVEGPAWQAHIAISAARWCLFWSEHGHGMEADW
jgi:hypothetical protein